MAKEYAGLERLISLLNADGEHREARAAQAAHDQAISEGSDKSDAFRQALGASRKVLDSTSEPASSTTTGAQSAPQSTTTGPGATSSAATGPTPAADLAGKRKRAPEASSPKPVKKPRVESPAPIPREDLVKRLAQMETRHAIDLYTIITEKDMKKAQSEQNKLLTTVIQKKDVKLKDMEQKLIDKYWLTSKLSCDVADSRSLVDELRERIRVLEAQKKTEKDVPGHICDK